MSNIANDLEQVQRDLLFFDLSQNPYFNTGNNLKSDTQIVIQAINQIVKQIDNFVLKCSTYMNLLNKKINSLELQLEKLNNSMLKIDSNNLKISNYLIDNHKAYEKMIADFEEIKLTIQNMKGVDNMIFNEKIILNKNESSNLDLKATDLNCVERQIKIYQLDQNSKTYKLINFEIVQNPDSYSAYSFTTFPIEIYVNEDDCLIIKNTCSLNLLIYVFRE